MRTTGSIRSSELEAMLAASEEHTQYWQAEAVRLRRMLPPSNSLPTVNRIVWNRNFRRFGVIVASPTRQEARTRKWTITAWWLPWRS